MKKEIARIMGCRRELKDKEYDDALAMEMGEDSE